MISLVKEGKSEKIKIYLKLISYLFVELSDITSKN